MKKVKNKFFLFSHFSMFFVYVLKYTGGCGLVLKIKSCGMGGRCNSSYDVVYENVSSVGLRRLNCIRLCPVVKFNKKMQTLISENKSPSTYTPLKLW